MALPNYPNNPTIGQEFVNGDKIFQWDGEKWKALSSADEGLRSDLAKTDSSVSVAGVEAQRLAKSVTSFATTAEIEATTPTTTGTRIENRERANAQYVLAAAGYVAQFGDLAAANGRVWQHIVKGPVNAREFGLFGGDSTSILQGIADWLDESKEVFFLDDFSLSSKVTFSNGGNIDFGNVTIDGSGLPNSTADRTLNIAMLFTGSVLSSAPISANINAGDDEFISDGISLSIGDTVVVKSDQLFDDNWDGAASNKRGEVLTIAEVNGSTYRVAEKFKFSYDSTQNLTVEKIDTLKFNIKGGKLVMGGVGSEHRGMFFEYCRDLRIEGVEVQGAEDSCIQLSKVHTASLDVTVKDATMPSSGFNTGYGVEAVDGSRNIDIKVAGYNCRHVVTGGGRLPSLETRVKGVAYDSGKNSWAFDCHEPCFNWTWDVEAYGCGGGIVLRGSNQRVRIKTENLASRSVTVKTFNRVTQQGNIQIAANTDANGSGCIEVISDFQPVNNIVIKCNSNDVTFAGVNLDGNATFGITNVKLDIDVSDTSTQGVFAQYVNGITGSAKIRGSGSESLDLTNCDNVNLRLDIVSVADGVQVTNSNNISFSGPQIRSSNGYGILTTNCTDVSCKTDALETTRATYDAWRAVDTVGGKLTGSTVNATRHGVFSSGTSDRFIISLNDGTGIGSATDYNLSGAGNLTANNI